MAVARTTFPVRSVEVRLANGRLYTERREHLCTNVSLIIISPLQQIAQETWYGQLPSGMKLLLVFAAVLVIAAATNTLHGFLSNLLHGIMTTYAAPVLKMAVKARNNDSSNTKDGNKYDNRPPLHTKEPGTRHNTKDGAGHGLFPHIIKGVERVLSPMVNSTLY